MNRKYDQVVATRALRTGIGPVVLLASARGLTGVCFGPQLRGVRLPGDDGGHAVLNTAEDQLGEYFAGRRTRFNLPLDLRGSAFQQQVWSELRRIPYGATCSYREIAQRIGNPKSVRAVGMANGANPVAIIIPCHRVIGSDGSLAGFSGGLRIKETLLEHEGALATA